MFVPLILLFGIFYFLLIRPQQKRQKDHKALLANLRKGDQVITAGGMYGKITGLTDTNRGLPLNGSSEWKGDHL